MRTRLKECISAWIKFPTQRRLRSRPKRCELLKNPPRWNRNTNRLRRILLFVSAHTQYERPRHKEGKTTVGMSSIAWPCRASRPFRNKRTQSPLGGANVGSAHLAMSLGKELARRVASTAALWRPAQDVYATET